MLLAQRDAEFFLQFAQGSCDRRFAGVAAAARQCPLTTMAAQARRAPGQHEGGAVGSRIGLRQHDRDRGPLQHRSRLGLAFRQPREISAALCDIPPGGIIERPVHAA